VRNGQWKLVWDTMNKAHQWELYDMNEDRTELHDLASAQPDRVATLRAAYEAWAKATDRAIPGQGRKKKGMT
jgi:arylsulfatase